MYGRAMFFFRLLDEIRDPSIFERLRRVEVLLFMVRLFGKLMDHANLKLQIDRCTRDL